MTGDDERGSRGNGESPPVSIVVPSYNRLDILPRCLEAITQQTFGDFEVIVVDDGSSDGTPEFLARFEAEHPDLRFRWLVNERNMGSNRSRNRGIREARGEFVAFLDSDSIAPPDWLERVIRAFASERVGAVTGMVDNPPPSNIYELAYRGTNRVHGAPFADRLVGCNMCIRRRLLLEYPLDEDLSYGCDEEGIYMRLRAAGYEQRLVGDAVVRHEHYFTRRSLFKHAYRGGKATAWLVYKYYLPQRLDMLPFMLAYVTMPLVLIDLWLGFVPLLFFAGALAAITYNDLFRKRKTVGETLRSFPVLVAYYHVRLFAYVTESIRLYFGKHDIQRERITPRARERSGDSNR